MALWTPTDFGAAVVGWWDAQDAATITTVSGAVSAWTNKGSGGNLAQTTAAARPAYGATAWDGTLPALTGDGVDDMLGVTTGTIPLGDYWWFVVAERDTQVDTNTTVHRPMLTTARSSGGALALLGPERPTADASQTRLTARGGGAGSTTATINGFTAGTKAIAFMAVAATLRLRMTGSAEQTASVGATTATVFRIFADTNTARAFKGKIAEVVGINPASLPGGGTDAERQLVEGYAAWRWGIALPSGHPYEFAAPTTGGAYSLTAAVGGFALSGQAAALTAARRVVAATGNLALAGQQAALRANRKLAAASGPFSLVGQNAALTYGQSGGYRLTAAAGIFAVTGQSAAFIWSGGRSRVDWAEGPVAVPQGWAAGAGISNGWARGPAAVPIDWARS